MDTSLDEIKLRTCTYWEEKYEPLTEDMTKGIYTGRYRLGSISFFVQDTSPF